MIWALSAVVIIGVAAAAYALGDRRGRNGERIRRRCVEGSR